MEERRKDYEMREWVEETERFLGYPPKKRVIKYQEEGNEF